MTDIIIIQPLLIFRPVMVLLPVDSERNEHFSQRWHTLWLLERGTKAVSTNFSGTKALLNLFLSLQR